MTKVRRGTGRAKRAEIYRKAAKLIEDEVYHTGRESEVRFSCCAVAEAEGIFSVWNSGRIRSRLADTYRELFPGNFGDEYNEENQNHRILALCLMAAMVEAGDA